MKIKYDDSVDAAYISLIDEASPGTFDFTYACDPEIVKNQIHLDFDTSGKLMGIEILNASQVLPANLLKQL
jgi:uncharacterized protein YuzE